MHDFCPQPASDSCETCHGRVDRMPLMVEAVPFTMDFCLDCHRDPAPRFDIAGARRPLAGCSGKLLWTSLEEIVEAGDFREWIEAEFPTPRAAGSFSS